MALAYWLSAAALGLAYVEHADQIVEVGVQGQRVAVAVGAPRRGSRPNGPVTWPSRSPHHALRGGLAEMGAEAEIHGAEVRERVFADRPAAQHHEAAPVHELIEDRVDEVLHVVEREVGLGDRFRRQAPRAHASEGGIEGAEMARFEVDREIVLALEAAAFPGAGMIDAMGYHRRHGHLRHGVATALAPHVSLIRPSHRRRRRPCPTIRATTCSRPRSTRPPCRASPTRSRRTARRSACCRRPRNGAGSVAHCTLRPGQVSRAVRHRTVEEVWHFLSGRGELWRAIGDVEEELLVHPGMSVTIPLGTRFQFRTVGGDPLVFVLVTTPPWPGDDEAVRVADHWPPTPPGAGSGRGGA